MTVTIQIPKEIEARLLSEVEISGVPLAQLVRDVVVGHFEDTEDRHVAAERLGWGTDKRQSSQLRSERTLGWTIEQDPRVANDLRRLDKSTHGRPSRVIAGSLEIRHLQTKTSMIELWRNG